MAFVKTGFVAALAAVAAGLAAEARVAVGENILVNGALEADQVDFPQGWTFFPTRMVRPEWNPTGGPDGMPCVTFAHDGDGPSGKRQMRQMGIRLSPKGRYRISAWVRPRDGFRTERFWFLAVNQGWHAARGVRELPPVGKWTRVSGEFSGFKSKGDYYCTVSLADFHGSIDIADLRLEALDEDAAAGSDKAELSQFQSAPRIVPWGPLLGEIPKTKRAVSFRFLGQLPPSCRAEDCDMVLAGDGLNSAKPANAVSQPLAEINTFKLPEGADGGVMSLKVVSRVTGSNIVERTFRYKTVDVPSADSLKKHRRLNNYVTEVLCEKASTAGVAEFTFGVARRKWMFVVVKGKGGFSLRLDGEKVMSAATPRHEAFREVAPGDHRIVLDGAQAGDEITVRTIPEILNYAPVPSRIEELPPYDWEFQKKYALPAVTTLNGGTPPDAPGEMEEFRASGRKWIANMHTTKPKSADDICARFKSAKGLSDPRYDGVTCDEQFCGRDEANSHFMLGLRRYDLGENPTRAIYTWLVGKPMSGIFDAEFLAECANASLGRSRVLTETYCRSRATEQEARAYIEAYICESMRRYRSAWPEILPSMGMILGNFVQSPILSLHHHCEMDYRYFLDMQFNALANDPEMDGIGVAGYWGSYYQDVDSFRWCFELLRHYCLEGATDMLSGKYGLKFNPGFVKNPDFRSGLEGWNVEGDVSLESVKDFGERSLGLYGGAGKCGDAFAVFARGEKPNRISQKISGLEPGETYTLQFATFDADDAKAHRFAPRKIAVAAEFGACAEVLPDCSWVHVDKRTKTRYGDKCDARVNINYIVFKAKAAELDLSFTDAAAKPGERLGLNWIYLAKRLR